MLICCVYALFLRIPSPDTLHVLPFIKSFQWHSSLIYVKECLRLKYTKKKTIENVLVFLVFSCSRIRIFAHLFSTAFSWLEIIYTRNQKWQRDMDRDRKILYELSEGASFICCCSVSFMQCLICCPRHSLHIHTVSHTTKHSLRQRAMIIILVVLITADTRVYV